MANPQGLGLRDLYHGESLMLRFEGLYHGKSPQLSMQGLVPWRIHKHDKAYVRGTCTMEKPQGLGKRDLYNEEYHPCISTIR